VGCLAAAGASAARRVRCEGRLFMVAVHGAVPWHRSLRAMRGDNR
jgi:hypothetical protein